MRFNYGTEEMQKNVAEIATAYADLVGAKNMLQQMKDGKDKTHFALKEIRDIRKEIIPRYMVTVPMEIMKFLPVKPSDLEKLIGEIVSIVTST